MLSPMALRKIPLLSLQRMQSSNAVCRALSAGSSTSTEVARSSSLQQPLQRGRRSLPPGPGAEDPGAGCSPLGVRSCSPSSRGGAGERRCQRVRETSLCGCDFVAVDL